MLEKVSPVEVLISICSCPTCNQHVTITDREKTLISAHVTTCNQTFFKYINSISYLKKVWLQVVTCNKIVYSHGNSWLHVGYMLGTC